MARSSNRDQILSAGLKVIHAHGFAGASVRDIVKAAGVPQGSFTNHFESKEAFGLEVIDLYFANSRKVIAATLTNDALPPLERLEAFIDANAFRQPDDMRNGCLFGNFAAESCEGSERIRERLVEIFAEIQAAIVYCLEAAVTEGQLPADFDCEEAAGFVVSSLQGVSLLGKAQRSSVPGERFKRLLFGKILRA